MKMSSLVLVVENACLLSKSILPWKCPATYTAPSLETATARGRLILAVAVGHDPRRLQVGVELGDVGVFAAVALHLKCVRLLVEVPCPSARRP